MKVSERMRSLRENHALTQQQIADILNTSQQYYSEYENGKREIPTRHVIKLCQFYDVSADYLLGLTDTYPLSDKSNCAQSSAES